MENTLETTFKNLQADKRYEKLKRTLKMALLKNAERRSAESGDNGKWPNVSSINDDCFDTSLVAMSVRSSRVGSEVVSSSTNLRDILLHKRYSNGPRNTVATSSENQFSTNKDNDDSAMMPPPRTPIIGFGKTKRFGRESQRVPLLNMPVNLGRDTNGFSISTPASSISSIAKCMGPASVNSSTIFQENNNYHGRDGYGEAVSTSAQTQERSFYRWRVLLNDKGLLIIKGTLECGKVARSKPVIRRLTPTSVQSIFKHTYHLQGNLVDDRSELPEYVRGKFYNGFPDDWENVYHVWRNFVNDGNRLSFRWPTPVSDSDDDIKSGVTEFSYRPGRYKKPSSPRKCKRSAKTSSMLDLSVATSENGPDLNRCACSHNASSGTPLEMSIKDNHPPPENLQRSHSKSNHLKEPCKSDATIIEKQTLHECSATSLNNTDKNSVSSLTGIIPEDKLNIIIDNLTNKNCPIEYINKIVEMFDCMKYVVSYQSSVENESVRGTSVTHENKASRSPMKKDRSIEEKSHIANTMSSKNQVNTLHPPIPKVNEYGNQLACSSAGSVANEKSYKDHSRQTRRKLTAHDYESSESDNDVYGVTRKTSTLRFPTSNERLRKTRKYKNPADSAASKTSREYVKPERSSDGLRKQYTEFPAVRTQRHDSSISDDDFVVGRKREPKLGINRAFVSPRKIGGAGKENRKGMENYDSSISITEDEGRYTERPKANDMWKDNYDSSISITEDEHRDVHGRNRMNIRKYYHEPKSVALELDMHRNENSRDDRKRLNDLNYRPETNSRPLEQGMSRNGDNRGARKRLGSLDCYSASNFHGAEQDMSRNGDILDNRKKLKSLDYHPDLNSHPIEQDISRRGDVLDDRKLQDSLRFHAELNSCPSEQDTSRNTPLRILRVPRKTPIFASSIAANDDRDSVFTPNPTLKVHGSIACSNENHLANEQEDDSPHLSSDIKRSKKLNANHELTEIESSKTYVNNRPNQKNFQRSPDSPKMPPSKIETSRVIKKPTVISTEIVNINLKAHNWPNSNSVKEINKNAGNSPQKYVDVPKGNSPSDAVKNNPINWKSPADIPEPTNTPEPMKPTTRSKDANSTRKVQDGKSSARAKKIENDENNANNAPVAEYGSEDNPKLLTAWVPAVVCDEDGDGKCHLTFEGKLLNEAGHVANRKFVTDFVRRRLSPKVIETISHEFYKLVGDLNDTKHVVPKDLIKLCHSGCPGKIGNFCERWQSLTGEIYKSPPKERLHNTSVKCLSVPMSSRGRRILPPLNYWAGERVVTKDHETMYSPGNSQESSILSSLENTTQEIKNKKNSPKARLETKKKKVEKISPSSVSKLTAESPRRELQKARGGKRRLSKNVQISSSESDNGAETKSTLRNRKIRVIDKVLNTENLSTRKLRNSVKNPASPQSLEHASVSPKKGSFEKSSDPEAKPKFRKRQKIDEKQGTMQQFVKKRPSEVKCTYYKNLPMHDGDLSEDQLSTM